MTTLTVTRPAAMTLAPKPAPPFPGRAWPDDYPPVHVRGMTLRPVPEDVCVARRFVGDYCDSRGISRAVRDDAVLCCSEVATNLRHAQFPPGRRYAFLQVRQHGPFLSVRLFDPDVAHLPCLRNPASDLGAECGRGLASIVGALACRLEFGRAAHSLKVVSFDIDCLPSRLR